MSSQSTGSGPGRQNSRGKHSCRSDENVPTRCSGFGRSWCSASVCQASCSYSHGCVWHFLPVFSSFLSFLISRTPGSLSPFAPFAHALCPFASPLSSSRPVDTSVLCDAHLSLVPQILSFTHDSTPGCLQHPGLTGLQWNSLFASVLPHPTQAYSSWWSFLGLIGGPDLTLIISIGNLDIVIDSPSCFSPLN